MLSIQLITYEIVFNSKLILDGVKASMMDFHPVLWLFSWFQWILDKLLSPSPPPPHAHLGRPRIAVIGAGLTGISAASHCVGHGFDVTIFEAGDENHLGGIWSVSHPC